MYGRSNPSQHDMRTFQKMFNGLNMINIAKFISDLELVRLSNIFSLLYSFLVLFKICPYNLNKFLFLVNYQILKVASDI